MGQRWREAIVIDETKRQKDITFENSHVTNIDLEGKPIYGAFDIFRITLAINDKKETNEISCGNVFALFFVGLVIS